MRIDSSLIRTFLAGLFLFSPAAVLGQSKWAIPFENYRRTHDSDSFGREMRQAGEKVDEFQDDITYLCRVVMDSSYDEMAQTSAARKLGGLAFGIASNAPPQLVELFKQAMVALETHLDAAWNDENSTWRLELITLTATLGLQPSPHVLPLFYATADSTISRYRTPALFALARLKPLPSEARRRILADENKVILRSDGVKIRLDLLSRLDLLVPALDDAEVMRTFTRFLESEKQEEQDAAIEAAFRSAPLGKPALEPLRRLERRRGLKQPVAANIARAIKAIEEHDAELRKEQE